MSLWSSTLGHARTKSFLESALNEQRLPHALLLTGIDSIGKKRLAYALAQKISCNSKTACGSCPQCLQIGLRQSEKILEITAEGAQIKIDQVRKITQFLSLKEDRSARFVIIDEVQKLNLQSGNALLKTIEEPPENCYIFMTAPSSQSVLSTIRSRSQVLRMAPLSKLELSQIPELKGLSVDVNYGGVSQLLMMADEDLADLKIEASSSLGHLVNGNSNQAFKSIQTTVKEQEKSLKLVRLWRQIFRDAWVNKQTHKEFILDQEQAVSLSLASLPTLALELMTKDMLSLESQILGHLDRSLIFESFFNRADQFIKAS